MDEVYEVSIVLRILVESISKIMSPLLGPKTEMIPN